MWENSPLSAFCSTTEEQLDTRELPERRKMGQKRGEICITRNKWCFISIRARQRGGRFGAYFEIIILEI